MRKIVGLASLYEPLEFLEARIRNLNACETEELFVLFYDCSSPETESRIPPLLKLCAFDHRYVHLPVRTTLYWTWNRMIVDSRSFADYYTTVNVDDIHDPSYFTKMGEYFRRHPKTVIAGCPWMLTRKPNQPWPPEHDDVHDTVDTQFTMGHFPMWKSWLHDQVGLFHPEMKAIGDAYFWEGIRSRYGRGAMGVHPEILGCHVLHDHNLFTQENSRHDHDIARADSSMKELPQ